MGYFLVIVFDEIVLFWVEIYGVLLFVYVFDVLV